MDAGVVVKVVLLTSVGFFSIILGLLVLFRSLKDKGNISFFFLTLGAFLWTLGHALFESVSVTNSYIYLIIYMIYAGAAIIPPAFTMSLIFIGPKKNSPILISLAWLFILLYGILLITLILSGAIFDRVYQIDNIKIINFSKYYFWYPLYFITSSILGIYIFINKYTQVKSKSFKLQLKLMSVGVIFTMVLGTATNLILPLYGSFKLFSVTPITSIISVILIAYAIIIHNLWDFKKILVEVLIGMLVLMSLINFAISPEYVGLLASTLFKSIAIVITLIVALSLHQSFIREKLAKKGLTNLNKKLKELDEKKNEFLHIATHQLRGPITAINGYASLMVDGDYGKMPKSAKEPIENILSASKVMSETINDYMNIARIEEDNVVQNMTEFDLCKLVDDRAEVRLVNAQDKGIKMTIEHDVEDNKCMVKADKNNITQVLNALLENAIKYTHKGEVRVRTELSDDSKHVRVSIKDTGIGVAKDEVAGLFDKFTRADNAKETDAFGTGMGLFIAKNLIEANKGKIWVESEGLNKGSTFTIELPVINAK